ncbi:NfeD family protein [Candidatus Nitrospira nitrificans]|uniref:Membrane-bound serine protease n=1 Tax=Candidatus Nitrospira nitrificans TaxID=1742973 RepID=A0A0S4LGI2_9BACT|nr:nodulation protein NfeD [Candidatus Nitrospira nitrificans]CUS35672.1 Membrane-bound serine protease [Candidatus Nitrospira nitrificans]
MRGTVFPYRAFGRPILAATMGGAVIALCLILMGSPAYAGEVIVASYEGVINPVAAEYLHDALAFAHSSDAQALIFKLDTPGGLDTSMRLMIKEMIGSPLPVIVFVAPSGGRAASAGVFITMAAHVAAMAPGTNIGAAHPVAMGGGEMDGTMKEKVENDATAYIKSIAEQRGRNVSWAEDAVRKSISATEQEAVKLKIIDMVAENIPSLLKQLNGRTITMATGSITFSNETATLREFPMGTRLELLKTLSDPNIAYLLMSIGTIGIMAELYSPGAILPGIIGAISLILAFYSLQSLPVNYAGALLVILGVVFLLLEISVTSYGLLALGGLAAMTLGGLLLIKSDAPFMQVSLSFLLPTVMTIGALVGTVIWTAAKSGRRGPVTGVEAMIGSIGIAKTDLDPRGQIALHGEIWEATSQTLIRQGEAAEVTSVEGLTVKVAPFHKENT